MEIKLNFEAPSWLEAKKMKNKDVAQKRMEDVGSLRGEAAAKQSSPLQHFTVNQELFNEAKRSHDSCNKTISDHWKFQSKVYVSKVCRLRRAK